MKRFGALPSSLLVFGLIIIFLYASSWREKEKLLAVRGSEERFSQTRGNLSSVQFLRRNTKDLKNKDGYHFMVSESPGCQHSPKVHLLILVTSAVGHRQHRQAIRKTWGAADRPGVRVVFLLGDPNESNIQNKVVDESHLYKDIVQEDFLDSYLNLTIKTMMGIKWAWLFCSNADFVLKTDDDIFVNVPFLLEKLSQLKNQRIFLGCIKQRKSFRPVGSGDAFPVKTHPLFAAGAGYAFGGVLLRDLFETSLKTKLIPVEDVYVTAHLAKAVKAHPPVHDDRFSCGEMLFKDCDIRKVFTAHRISPGRMISIWNKLQSNCAEKA